uniref:NADH-ubiquinone oxidoreductase chain 3 n=1 Tax=Amoebidium parasiticum TaxID=4881 RepID=Q8M0B5_AMOPA|nr:NADH dehydrogenase subunit 3 [Amoebidium parasiticum]
MSVYFHNQYLPIVWLIVVSIAIAVVLVIASYFLAVQSPDPEKVSAYECGFQPYSDAREKFEVRFFLVAILFILFDLEITLLVPFALVINQISLMGFWNVWLFVILLTLGLVFEWRSGALEWQ